MTFDELKNEVMTAMENKPKQWRNGQFVFNYIDEHYGVARRAQFEKHVDCFYNDDVIDDFIKTCAELLINGDDIVMVEDQYMSIMIKLKNHIKENNNPQHISTIISDTMLYTINSYKFCINAVLYYDENGKLTDIVPVWWEFFIDDMPSDTFEFNKFVKYV